MNKKTAIFSAVLLMSLAVNVYALFALHDARRTADAAIVQSSLALDSVAAICEQVPRMCKQEQL